MPTYEYACPSCGTHVEVYQRFSDDPLTECGVCGGRLRKVFHPAGILFKGSGFYATDSRAPKGKAETKEAGSRKDGSEPAAKSGSGESKAKGGGSGSDASSGAGERSA